MSYSSCSERRRYRGSRGRVLSEQTELGDRLLTLHIPGERLGVGLNQTLRNKPVAATLIKPAPRLPLHNVRAQRFTITLNIA